MPCEELFQRLPLDVYPKHYDVRIEVNLTEFTYKGSISIDLEVKKKTRTVVLNCVKITLGDVTFAQNDIIMPASTVELEKHKEIAILTFPKELLVGMGKLQIDFNNILDDSMKGLYLSTYNQNGAKKYGAVSQFQVSDARRCFPCWDEPAIKSYFDITLVHKADLLSLSNMPRKDVSPLEGHDGWCIAKFETTPLISTYLVAMIVGEYDFLEHKTPNTLIKVYTPVNKSSQGQFALKVMKECLAFYESYFNIAYPLPKLDSIAIADFLIGAMENWGLITYRERVLLVDEKNSSLIAKRNVAETITHELAHQWFGNLVTLEWWTHLWLNEGYATFSSYLAVDHLFPEFDSWTQFNVNCVLPAMGLDCLRSSHPIEVPVGAPAEVEEIFDTISYQKGAAIIRMLHDYLGSEEFKIGMNVYLTRHQYGNAVTEDLWKALEDSSKKPVCKVMSSWTKQMGYPFITISEKRVSDTKVILKFEQQWFLLDGSKDTTRQWHVPISILCASSPTKPAKEFLLDSPYCEIEFNDEKSWIKVNAGATAFYRTRYTDDLLSRLTAPISEKIISPADRLCILDDLFALAQAGYHSTVDVLRQLLAYKNEGNYAVWCTVCSCLKTINKLLSYTSYDHLFHAFGRKLLRGIVDRIGWDPRQDEESLDAMLRSIVLSTMGAFGDEGVIEEAKKRLANHIAKKEIIPADNRSAVYRTVAAVAVETDETFEQMIKLYKASDLQEEKVRAAVSLGATKNRILIQKVLDFAMSSDVRKQDAIHVLVSLTQTLPGRKALWDFIKSHVDELKQRYEGGTLLIILVSRSVEDFASEDMAEECSAFFRRNPIQSTERALQQAVETVRLNAAWLNRDATAIEAFLKEQLQTSL